MQNTSGSEKDKFGSFSQEAIHTVLATCMTLDRYFSVLENPQKRKQGIRYVLYLVLN